MSGFTASQHDDEEDQTAPLQRLSGLGNLSLDQQHHQLPEVTYRATGRELIKTINEYFRQIVNLPLPALHRYMMWSASKGKHLFGDGS